MRQTKYLPTDSCPDNTNAAHTRASPAAKRGCAWGSSLAKHFSSLTDEWATPQSLFEELDREFHFTLDPCSTHQNAKCFKHFTRAEDGLAQDWAKEVVFMNPPYAREIGLWVRKAYDSAQAGATVVCLIPARTDTLMWHNYAMKGEIRFLKGRLKFGNAQHGAPFPSAIVIFLSPLLGDKNSSAEPLSFSSFMPISETTSAAGQSEARLKSTALSKPQAARNSQENL